MGKKTIDREREYYRLWIEYLKLSKDYKEFCFWFEEKRKNPNLAKPEKFHKRKDSSGPKEIPNYLTFGNIHDPKFSFDKWFESHKKGMNYAELHKSPKAIEDFTESIGWYIDTAANSFKRKFNREPSLQELKEYLAGHIMKRVFGNRLYLMVDVTDKAVIEQFKTLVKKKKEEPIVKGHYYSSIRNRQPIITYELIDELKTYLEIYKLRESGLKPQEVIQAHNPKHKKIEKGYDSIERLYRLYYQKAKSIIKNTEYGIFPIYPKKRKAKTP